MRRIPVPIMLAILISFGAPPFLGIPQWAVGVFAAVVVFVTLALSPRQMDRPNRLALALRRVFHRALSRKHRSEY